MVKRSFITKNLFEVFKIVDDRFLGVLKLLMGTDVYTSSLAPSRREKTELPVIAGPFMVAKPRCLYLRWRGRFTFRHHNLLEVPM